MKDSIMSYEIANQDTENTAINVKSSEEVMEAVKKVEKIIRSNNYSISMACLPTSSNI